MAQEPKKEQKSVFAPSSRLLTFPDVLQRHVCGFLDRKEIGIAPQIHSNFNGVLKSAESDFIYRRLAAEHLKAIYHIRRTGLEALDRLDEREHQFYAQIASVRPDVLGVPPLTRPPRDIELVKKCIKCKRWMNPQKLVHKRCRLDILHEANRFILPTTSREVLLRLLVDISPRFPL